MKVAVYGTLRSGFGNNRLLEGQKMVSAGRFDVPYRMVSLGGFPGLVRSQKPNSIYLEIYEVDNQETLRRLDGLEGYRGPGANNFYDRVPLPEAVGEDGEVPHVYVLLGGSYATECPPIDDGDWANHAWTRRRP